MRVFVGREEASLPLAVVLDDMAADQVAQEPGADDLQQVSDGDVGDARQGVEHRLAVVGARHEDSIQHDRMKVRQANSYGGPIKYVFGVNAEGQRRHDAAERILRHLPPRATVTGGGFTTPYVSNRPDAFNLTISGATNAEYMFIPSEAADFIVDEKATVTHLLKSSEFGVVAIEPPFALARRGYSTSRNEELIRRW
jgi:hypothetical protein